MLKHLFGDLALPVALVVVLAIAHTQCGPETFELEATDEAATCAESCHGGDDQITGRVGWRWLCFECTTHTAR